MKILNKKLTSKGIEITLDTSDATVDMIFIDNANNENYNSAQLKNHDQIADFTQDNANLEIHPNSTTPPFSIITIVYHTDLSDDKQYLSTMFVNDYSIFKAKIRYVEELACCQCCDTCKNCAKSL